MAQIGSRYKHIPRAPIVKPAPPRVPSAGLAKAPKPKPQLPKGPNLSKGKMPKRTGIGRRPPKPLPFDKRLVAPPSGTLTYGQLGKDTQAARDLEFTDQRRALNQAAGDVQVGQGAITNWFDQYKRDIAAGGQAAQSQLGQAQADLATRNQQGQAADTARLGQIDATNRADAQSRGAQYTPDNSAAQAQGSRQMLSDAYTNMLSSQGAARSAYAADRGAATSGAQLTARLGQQRAGQKINQQRFDLKGKEGAYANKYRSARIVGEQEAALARQTLGGNLAAKGAENRTANKKLGADTRYKQQQLGLQKQKLGESRNQFSQRMGMEQQRINATIQKNSQSAANTTDKAQQKGLEDSNKGLQSISDIMGKWDILRQRVNKDNDGNVVKPRPNDIKGELARSIRPT